MKSKIEKKLDEEFERIGIKPRVYHFTTVPAFNAVTVVTDRYEYNEVNNFIWQFTEVNSKNKATQLLHKLANNSDLYGVAICDRRDQFNRALGRIIAKGRLLKSLKEQK